MNLIIESMFNLRYGIYIVIFSMPLYLWQFSVAVIPVNFLEMMIYILFILWCLEKTRCLNFKKDVFARIYLFRKYYYSKIYYLLNIGITLLFLGVIISTALSSDLRTSLGIFKGWFVNPFLFFIVFINIIKRREDILWSLKSWLASSVVVSLIGVYYLLIGEMTFDGRLKAFFLSPNHLAMYLAPAFLIVFSFLLNNKKKKRLFNFIIFVVVALPLYFTYSYGAFLGIFIGLLYLVVKNKGLKIKKAYLFTLIFLLFSGFVLLSLDKFNQISSSENRSSLHSRVMIWNVAGEIVQDNPLFGVGPGTFQENYLSYANEFSEPYLEWAVPQPHNIFLAFYLQTGLIGFLGFTLILIWFFLNVKVIRNISERMYIINALMIYILVHGLVDTTYWKNDLALMFWIVIGLKILSSRNLSESDGKKIFL